MLFLQTRSTAKSLSTKTVILSTCFCLRKSQRCFGLSHQIPRRTFQRDEIEFTKLAHSPGQTFRCFRKIYSVLGQIRKSQCTQIGVASSFFRIGLRLPSNASLSCSFLSLRALRLGVRIASRVTDDEWSMSQVRLKIQLLSRLINSHPEYPIQQWKTFHA